jgi:hypothetical protein
MPDEPMQLSWRRSCRAWVQWRSAIDSEVTILARFLTNGDHPLPKHIARYVLNLTISEHDKVRMHELTARNRDDVLTPAEKKEMHDYGKAATVLSILKSKARLTLGVKLKT